MRKSILAAALAVALVTLACGVNFEVPVTEIKTGPTQTEDILVPLLEDEDDVANISLAFGAGDLELSPGAEDAVISGTATYNVEDFAPVVTVEDNDINISQGDLNVRGIPNFADDMENRWELWLGDTPMILHLTAGAYVGDYELGGIPLQGLEISDGAADVEVNFEELNPDEMKTFSYHTGASNVTIRNLANANVEDVSFRSGAGTYTIDFSGELQRDMNVSIESGISSVTLIIPEGVHAEVTFEGGFSNVSLDGEWEKSGDQYTQDGEGYTISITIKMAAGSLELKNK